MEMGKDQGPVWGFLMVDITLGIDCYISPGKCTYCILG